jgi:hypothetical protein
MWFVALLKLTVNSVFVYYCACFADRLLMACLHKPKTRPYPHLVNLDLNMC